MILGYFFLVALWNGVTWEDWKNYRALVADTYEVKEDEDDMSDREYYSSDGVADLSVFERNTGGQSRPAGSSQAAFNEIKYVYDPSSGYTDMSTLTGPRTPGSVLDVMTRDLRDLRSDLKWKDIDATSKKFLGDFAKSDPSKWGDKLAEKERFLNKMDASFKQNIEGIQQWITIGRMHMNRPDVKVDPKYRDAFEAKVNEIKDFIASLDG